MIRVLILGGGVVALDQLTKAVVLSHLEPGMHVTNVARHATASCCVVTVDDSRDPLHLTIEDDGVGLPRQTRAGGLGLRSMAERATELGGTCDISRSPSGGTCVRVTIPLEGAR